MKNRRFAVFILSHGRPHNVKTHKTLRSQGYTGDIYVVVDDEDATIDEYREVYGDKVIVFSKEETARQFDEGDNFNDRRAVFYARNASSAIAERLGLDYFLQLDDDYTAFYRIFAPDLSLLRPRKKVQNLDALFAIMLDFYASIPALTIAFCQGGDLIGGDATSALRVLGSKRKAMNTFFCSTKRPFPFMGRMNEDVNTYTLLGYRGGLFLTLYNVAMMQMDTQAQKGGMTDLYVSQGTYVKSFYTVMYAPACAKIAAMKTHHARIHHQIAWEQTAPRIIREEHRKA